MGEDDPARLWRTLTIAIPAFDKGLARLLAGILPELKPIKETASDDYFYSGTSADDASALDDSFKLPEDAGAKVFHKLRVVPAGTLVDACASADLVMHLAPRSGHVRSSMAAGFYHLATSAHEVFTDPAQMERILGLDDDAPNDHFRARFAEGLRDAPQIRVIGLPMPLLERIAFYISKEQFDVSVNSTVSLFGGILAQWATDSTAMVRDGHT